ncbi:hypothetical protein O3M35_003523 [Rhynocoris fuscipes]|uniref:Integrator complex subunit 14 n=1 Tax=Rhynocoris fuscipes TaxID=488301 RepID=A0AAW1CNC1_9HEMI
MPTIILLDTSPGMDVCYVRRKLDNYSPLQFTISALLTFLDELSATSKLELVAVITSASEPKVLCPFTRDYELIKTKLNQIKVGSAFHLYEGLDVVETFVLGEWSSSQTMTIIAVYEESSVSELTSSSSGIDLSLTGKLLLLGLQDALEPDYQEVSPTIRAENLEVILLQPHLPITESSLQNLFSSIAESYYSQYVATMSCGHFSSKVTLWPAPENAVSVTDFDYQVYKPEPQLDILGFLDIASIGSPAAVSRHLVCPSKPPTEDEDDPNAEANVPSFCVLLHGALKVENMGALCIIANDWYGVLFSWADSKKKSNLVLALFEPGRDSVPWLGDLNALTIPSSPQECEGFPVKCAEKKSYAQSTVAWIRQPGLQSDIQKILRHARKLPEKTQQFYKELNRVRKAAICLGFTSLIEGLAALLERECTLLPGTAHPACAFQLTHAAGILREPYSMDPKYTIMPMKMSF